MPIKTSLSTNWIYTLLTIAAIGYITVSYCLPRDAFIWLFFIFTAEFLIYCIVLKHGAKQHSIGLFWFGLLIRTMLLFALPNLSEDVYRFIWDGRLAAQGINPYAFLPSEIMQSPLPGGITEGLYNQLNSASYYSIYPPVIQGTGWLAAKFFPVNVAAAVLFLKLILLLADLGSYFLVSKLLVMLKLPSSYALLYFLNPLVIMEFTGNVHFEGLMIFFMLLAIWLSTRACWKLAIIPFALAIATKLIPVFVLPLFIRKFGWIKGGIFSLVTLSFVAFLFWLSTDVKTLLHIWKSIDLYFRNFEFNASAYYLVRWIGWQIKGYNIIAIAGPVLSAIAAVIILYISWYKKILSWQHFLLVAMFVFTTWFLLATTVHPWYISSVLVFSIFTPYRFPVLWSYTALWSYAAYRTNPAQEIVWLIALGYAASFGYGLWEIYQQKNKNINGCTNLV